MLDPGALLITSLLHTLDCLMWLWVVPGDVGGVSEFVRGLTHKQTKSIFFKKSGTDPYI